MKKIELSTTYKKLLADIFTPVGIYLRLRDRFRDTILLESTDFHAGENSFSFIGINAIAGIEVTDLEEIEFKLPLQRPEKTRISKGQDIPGLLWEFMQRFEVREVDEKAIKIALGLFGYTSYDGVQFFENIRLTSRSENDPYSIPLV